MFVFGGNNGGIKDDYKITNSLRFRSSASAYLSRTPASSTNTTTWTYSVWLKRGILSSVGYNIFGAGTGTTWTGMYFDAADTLTWRNNTAGTTTGQRTTTQVFRDPSAWYHIVFIWDTTNATAADRMQVWINGSRVTSFGTSTDPSSSRASIVNTNVVHAISKDSGSAAYLDCYMTEVNFIDGQALTPSSFGYTHPKTGVWRPKPYTGTYGTNGFYLKFSDIATTSGSNAGLGKDFSSNGNYWTTNNISVTSGTTYDAMTDVPTLTSTTVANYCTLNPLQKFVGTISNANLNISAGDGANFRSILSTMALPSTGKYYFEFTGVTVETGAGTGYQGVGICDVTDAISATYIGGTANSYAYYNLGYKGNNGTLTAGYGATWATGDVIGCAVDMDAGTIVFYKNNTSQGTAYSGLSGTKSYTPAISILGTTSNMALNCGQRPFSYTPPTGYKALNTYNLPKVTIAKGNKYMDATTYSGNSSTQTITNAGAFKPDFVWIKARNNPRSNVLYDAIRGTSNLLISNLADAEATQAQLTSFNSNGWSMNGAGSYTSINLSGDTYVGWQWQAGQGTTSSNTDGSITSTTSVNASAGFSIVTYTGNGTIGATIGHGLGVSPSLIIAKRRNLTDNWPIYHKSLGATKYLFLNLTDAVVTNNTTWNNTEPTSSVFTVYNDNRINASGSTYVAYCWAEIAGFSKFGSYTGNGSTNGTFVYTGFRPKYVLVKNSTTASSATNWFIFDSVRDTYNVMFRRMQVNTTSVEETNLNVFDFLSNGFKLRDTNVAWNANGSTYIYVAFAENPFKYSNAR